MSPRPFDLALTEAIETRITAVRDVMRATRNLSAARVSNIPTRIEGAKSQLSSADMRATAARSSLEAAIALEAEDRA